MILNTLICAAASAYPDAWVLQYWNLDTQEPVENRDGGDTLALFIARELHDTWNPDATDAEQIATATRVMHSAASDLDAVSRALGRLAEQQEQMLPCAAHGETA